MKNVLCKIVTFRLPIIIESTPSLTMLLIDPGSSRCEINEPIGISSLHSYTQQFLPHEIKTDLLFFPLSSYTNAHQLAQYDVVGISTKIGSLEKVHKIVSDVQTIPSGKQPIVVLGDLLATFATDQMLDLFPNAVMVRGEGEDALVGIVESIIEWKKGTHLLTDMLLENNVTNIAFNNHNSRNYTNRKNINLENSPLVDRSFASSVAMHGGIIRAEASRGCSYGRCSFCAIQYKYSTVAVWRPVPLDRIIEELRVLSHLGIKNPYYTDEDFFGNDPMRAYRLAEAIIVDKQRGNIDPEMSLYIDLRTNSILSPGHTNVLSGKDILSKLYEAGLREVFVGIESGTLTQLKRFRKPGIINTSIKALGILNDLGIHIDIGFIMFDPKITLTELLSNIQFIKDHNLNTHDARLTKSLRIEPGTPILNEYMKSGLISGKLDVDNLTYPYTWIHSDAEAAFMIFSHWEQQHINYTYRLQALTRGEIISEQERLKLKKHLGEIRSIEIDVLEKIVTSFLNGTSVNESDFNKDTDKIITILNSQFINN
ncbi:B12-binding domain-containing radical SAM protein [Candidatus Margulisiibacteriota bacterium]